MQSNSFKTSYITPEAANKQWVVVDAADQTLGRFASKVAKVLRGKYKPVFTPNMDCGDNVIIINANQIKVSGAKESQKLYITFSGYPSGQHKATYAETDTRRCFAMQLKACFHRESSADTSCATSTFSKAQSTTRRLRSQ